MFFIKDNSGEYGPYSSQQLFSLGNEGRLHMEMQIRTDANKRWGPITNVKKIAHLLVPPPIPVDPYQEKTDFAVKTSTYVKTKLGKTPTSWLAIFDWKFEYYLTPWIIRLLWVVFLLITSGILCILTIGLLVEMMPTIPTAQSSTSQFESRGNYAQQQPILPSWLTLRFAKVIMYIVSVIAIVINILLTRMIMELMIVVFRIAEDIGFLKRKSAE